MFIKTILALPFFCLLIQSCVIFIPEYEKNDGDCELLSQESKLAVYGDIPSGCNDEICLAAILASGASTLVVSGSIVLTGNTVHWLERQGKCEDSYLKRKANEFKRLMTKQFEQPQHSSEDEDENPTFTPKEE